MVTNGRKPATKHPSHAGLAQHAALKCIAATDISCLLQVHYASKAACIHLLVQDIQSCI